MRLLLVGRPEERERLRAEIDHSSFTIVGEFATLVAARASGLQADGIILADPQGPRRFGGEAFGGEAFGGEAFGGGAFGGEAFGGGAFGGEAFEEPLTTRELEVLNLLVEGLSNKAIARRLGISDQTVKFHVAGICGKLGAANRTDAVRRALRRGLVSL